MSRITPAQFRKIIHAYFKKHGRDFAWRCTRDPYAIAVSEVMLQQTQTDRVRVKYEEFLRAFPDWPALAAAPLRRVLAVWQGLGYNRRAKALKEIAEKVMKEYDGALPSDSAILETFPGIGKMCSGSIAVFAFNKPSVFIETNIRSVFIHFFFPRRRSVRDDEILPLVRQTLDQKNPREWYFALMDYGAMLKRTVKNPSQQSAHHRPQSRFEGSDRQVRGFILKVLVQKNYTVAQLGQLLQATINADTTRIQKNLRSLIKEGLVQKKRGGIFTIA